jgi:acetyl/propionyl-CoA carboxylase alpha subunit
LGNRGFTWGEILNLPHLHCFPLNAGILNRIDRSKDSLFDGVCSSGFMAPRPGKVVKVLVKDGEAVRAGQTSLVLEATTMEQATRSPADGVVKQVLVREGDQVTGGQILVVMNK